MFLDSVVCDLQCKVGEIGGLPLGDKSLIIPPLELFICGCALLCELSDYTVVGTALSST